MTRYEWMVREVDERALQETLDSFSEEGYTVTQAERNPAYTFRWVVIGRKLVGTSASN